MTAEEKKNAQASADAVDEAQELDAEDLNAVSAGATIFSEDDDPDDDPDDALSNKLHLTGMTRTNSFI